MSSLPLLLIGCTYEKQMCQRWASSPSITRKT